MLLLLILVLVIVQMEHLNIISSKIIFANYVINSVALAMDLKLINVIHVLLVIIYKEINVWHHAIQDIMV